MKRHKRAQRIEHPAHNKTAPNLIPCKVYLLMELRLDIILSAFLFCRDCNSVQSIGHYVSFAYTIFVATGCKIIVNMFLNLRLT